MPVYAITHWSCAMWPFRTLVHGPSMIRCSRAFRPMPAHSIVSPVFELARACRTGSCQHSNCSSPGNAAKAIRSLLTSTA